MHLEGKWHPACSPQHRAVLLLLQTPSRTSQNLVSIPAAGSPVPNSLNSPPKSETESVSKELKLLKKISFASITEKETGEDTDPEQIKAVLMGKLDFQPHRISSRWGFGLRKARDVIFSWWARQGLVQFQPGSLRRTTTFLTRLLFPNTSQFITRADWGFDCCLLIPLSRESQCRLTWALSDKRLQQPTVSVLSSWCPVILFSFEGVSLPHTC